MVSAWPEPPFAMHAAIIAGAHDGMEALACATTTTESLFLSIRLASPSETESAIVTLALWIAQSASTFRDAWSGGQGLGNTLVLFLTFRPPGKKGDRCSWLGNGLLYGHTRGMGLGSRESNFFLFHWGPDIKFDIKQVKNCEALRNPNMELPNLIETMRPG